MRFIKYIVIHCTAGYGDVEAIRRFWKQSLGWKNDGYHYFIYTDGTIVQLNPLSTITNGVKGYNTPSVHISYQGGVDRNNYNKAVDTRTKAQKESILKVLGDVYLELSKTQAIDAIKILGHRDFSPDKNGNGVIEPFERIKECPSFDVIPEYGQWQGRPAMLSKTLL